PLLAAAIPHPGTALLSLASNPAQRRIFAVYRTGGLRSPITRAMIEILEMISQHLESRAAWTDGGGFLRRTGEELHTVRSPTCDNEVGRSPEQSVTRTGPGRDSRRPGSQPNWPAGRSAAGARGGRYVSQDRGCRDTVR